MPDIRNIPAEAWDWEKGTLKRGLLDNVCNELDKQALAFALGLRANTGGRIVSLSMGPPFAERVLRYALSVGADAGVLLTDRKLGGRIPQPLLIRWARPSERSTKTPSMGTGITSL